MELNGFGAFLANNNNNVSIDVVFEKNKLLQKILWSASRNYQRASYNEAIRDFENVLSLIRNDEYPDEYNLEEHGLTSVMYLLSLSYLTIKYKLDRAEVLLKSICELCGDKFPGVQYALAQLYSIHNRLDEAQTCVEKGLQDLKNLREPVFLYVPLTDTIIPQALPSALFNLLQKLKLEISVKISEQVPVAASSSNNWVEAPEFVPVKETDRFSDCSSQTEASDCTTRNAGIQTTKVKTANKSLQRIIKSTTVATQTKSVKIENTKMETPSKSPDYIQTIMNKLIGIESEQAKLNQLMAKQIALNNSESKVHALETQVINMSKKMVEREKALISSEQINGRNKVKVEMSTEAIKKRLHELESQNETQETKIKELQQTINDWEVSFETQSDEFHQLQLAVLKQYQYKCDQYLYDLQTIMPFLTEEVIPTPDCCQTQGSHWKSEMDNCIKHQELLEINWQNLLENKSKKNFVYKRSGSIPKHIFNVSDVFHAWLKNIVQYYFYKSRNELSPPIRFPNVQDDTAISNGNLSEFEASAVYSRKKTIIDGGHKFWKKAILGKGEKSIEEDVPPLGYYGIKKTMVLPEKPLTEDDPHGNNSGRKGIYGRRTMVEEDIPFLKPTAKDIPPSSSNADTRSEINDRTRTVVEEGDPCRTETMTSGVVSPSCSNLDSKPGTSDRISSKKLVKEAVAPKPNQSKRRLKFPKGASSKKLEKNCSKVGETKKQENDSLINQDLPLSFIVRSATASVDSGPLDSMSGCSSPRQSFSSDGCNSFPSTSSLPSTCNTAKVETFVTIRRKSGLTDAVRIHGVNIPPAIQAYGSKNFCLLYAELKNVMKELSEKELVSSLLAVKQEYGKLSGMSRERITSAVLAHLHQMVIRDSTGKSRKSSGDIMCAICMEDLTGELTTLECQHTYHKICIKTWIKTNSICPICRDYTVIDDEYPPLPSEN